MPSKKDEKTILNKKNILVFSTLLIAFSFYLLLALISYLFTWQYDNIKWIEIFSSSDIVVKNITGKLGAYLSYILITRFIGLGAFAIPFITFIIGCKLIKIKILPIRKTLKTTIILALWLSLVLGYLDLYIANKSFLLGGLYGYALNKWLTSFIGHIGTISLIAFISFVILINLHENIWNRIHSYLYRKSNEIKIHSEDFEKSNDSIMTDDNASETNINEKDNVTISKEDNIEIEEYKEQTNIKKENNIHNQEPELEINYHTNENNEIKDGDHITIDTIFDPTQELSNYRFPTIDLLNDYSLDSSVDENEIKENKNIITETLKNYNIEIIKITANIGPTVTLYEIKPAAGIKISKIKNLENDIAMSLAALGIRIIAPIPGKNTIGIEVPNKKAQIVGMKSLISSEKFQKSNGDLPVVLGKTIQNEIFLFDLTEMPHLLVAGATGQGKSVGLNVILTSLLYKKHPTQLKLLLIDPKQVEFSLYNDLKNHFLATIDENIDDYIITDTDNAKQALLSMVTEMEFRYQLLKIARVRNIKEYNEKFFKRKLNPEKGHRFLPYIVIVIDEFADLIMMSGKEIEIPLARIAQKARAVGIHMIIATQRPSINVITGLIKANFPARISFRVTSNVDSRTILDQPGAEKLIGKGDLLFSKGSGFTRVQCGFLSTEEVEKIVDFIHEQQGLSPFVLPLPENENIKQEISLGDFDDLFKEVAYYVVESQSGSTSMIQRKFSVGFNRAGKIMDQLEAAKIVGPAVNGKPRKVLIKDIETLEQILDNLN